MKKLSKLIITQMNIRQIPCYVCAYEEDGKVMELRFEPVGEKSSLGNIYVGQIENIAANIGAAFVQISAGEKCYLQLSDAPNAIYASVKKGDRPLKAGDEILVQISREAMKGKLPAVTTNLNFTGKYLVLTTGDKKFGLSSKLSNDDRSRISKWMEAEVNRPDKEFGIIVRTNAADASKEEILKELDEQGRMKYTQRYMQHSDISVYKHCISVAYTSVELVERFSLNVNRKELIRGALLHDYFLYDWHEKNAGHRFHGFIHAGRALQNAKNDFELTRREENIISRHMFPLNIVPPMCKEAWLVCLADKICASKETIVRRIHIRRYKK